MIYKNKDIRKLYSWNSNLFIFGVVLGAIGLLLIICGFIFGTKAYNNIETIDDILARSGNHATRAAYFEITELPIEASSDKYGNYYLLTDGNEYRLGRFETEMYENIKSEIESNGSFKFEGMTLYIIDDDVNSEIASKASRVTGQIVIPMNMKDILGDVYIDYSKLSYGSVLWRGYDVNFIPGCIFLVVGLVIILVNAKVLVNSKKIISISNITADEIDNEADSKDTHWYNRCIFATPDLLVGFSSDPSNSITSTMAFRYEEIKRIYGVNKTDLSNVQPVTNKNHYQMFIEAADGNKYLFYDEQYKLYDRPYYIVDMNRLFERIKEHNPTVEYGPENTRYKTYRFTCRMVEGDDEYEEEYATELDDDMRESICFGFDEENVMIGYPVAEKVVSVSMSFIGDCAVEVKVGYFAESEKEIEATLYDFLKRRLKEGIYTEDFEVEFMPVEV